MTVRQPEALCGNGVLHINGPPKHPRMRQETRGLADAPDTECTSTIYNILAAVPDASSSGPTRRAARFRLMSVRV